MKTLFASILVLLINTQVFAGGAVVSGGRISALGDSKLRIQAAIDAITDASFKIAGVQVLDGGSVKINLLANDQQCRAIIFEISQVGGEIGVAKYIAINPQRAHCN